MTCAWALAVVDPPPAPLPPAEALLAAAPPGSAFAAGTLEVVDLEGSALVALRLERAPEPDVDALRAHDAMVRALAGAGAALLPARFGWVGERTEDLAAPLRARHDAVRDALERVRGAAQITVRARGGPGPTHDDDDRDAESGGPGARFLRRRARALSPPSVAGWAERSAALRPLLRAERIERGDPRTGERWRAYHLVDLASLDAYRRAAESLRAAEPELALSFGAPCPPYAFSALDELGAGIGAGA